MDYIEYLRNLATDLEFGDFSNNKDAPKILRDCSDHLFEATSKIRFQKEVLDGIRALLNLSPKDSLLNAVNKLIEEQKNKQNNEIKQPIPISRPEIKEELNNLRISYSNKDSTKYLWSKLQRAQQNKGYEVNYYAAKLKKVAQNIQFETLVKVLK